MSKNNRNKGISINGFYYLLLLSVFLLISSFSFAADLNKKAKRVKPKVNSALTKAQSGIASQTNRLIVRFKSNTRTSTKSNLHRSLGSRVKKSLKSVPGLQVIEVGPGKNIDQVLKQYQKDPSVMFVEPDYKISLKATPNEVRFPQLWGLNNTAQMGGSSDADINAPQAWDLTQGDSNVVVAVIDTGIDYSHEDLADNMWTNPGEIPGNGVDDDGNGYVDDVYGWDAGENDSDPMDEDGHGTHVAGTIGARGNNGTGVAGVNWNVSIIACKIFSLSNALDLQAFASDAVECLDYLRNLKVNHGVNIVATNNSWGWIGNPSQTLMDAVRRQQRAGILFVAASGNEALDTDQIHDNPSSYNIPNVISVAASTQDDAITEFSNTGKRTVHVAAPGLDILSSVPGVLPASNPHDENFIDDVESGAGAWSAQNTWGITNVNSVSGIHAWSDSPSGEYLDNTNSSLTSSVIDLSGFAGQTVYLGFNINYQIQDSFDELFVEISNNNGAAWSQLDSYTGFSSSWEFKSLVIPQVYFTSTFRFRFRLLSDDSITYDGVMLDDIGIGTTPYIANPSAPSNNYDVFSGTSMASPHVAGLAALIKANNNALTWHEIKNLIISSGTPISAMTNNTISGRRIRAFDTDNSGALSCNNQSVLARLQPVTNYHEIQTGEIVNISMLHINCDQPAGNVSVTITETGDTVELLDNGLGFDQVAGDGIYSAQIDLAALEEEAVNIEFPDSTTVAVNTIYNYYNSAHSYQWRDISAVAVSLFNGIDMEYDDETVYISTPFTIPFGDVSTPFNEIAIDTNGYIAMRWQGEDPLPISVPENFEIPLTASFRIVAPFWDDLYLEDNPATNVYWGVLGSAPNRELVITWQNVVGFFSPVGSPGMTFQVVFSENSSDIIFNYQDTVVPDSGVDNGIGATSAVQVTSNLGTQYSYNTASLFSGRSVIWTTTPPVTRSSPGGGGGSFGFLLALILPALMFRRFYKNSAIPTQ